MVEPGKLFFGCGSTVAAAPKAGNESQYEGMKKPQGHDSERFLKRAVIDFRAPIFGLMGQSGRPSSGLEMPTGG